MRLILPVPPSANRWYRKAGDRLYQPPAVLAYKTRVMVEVRNARIRKVPRAVPVSVTMHWYRKAKQGDLDKRMGVLLDALQGQWYENDAQISELHCYRLEDAQHPRLEVEVTPA